MKKLFLLILSLFSLSIYPQALEEFRAVKLTNVDSDVLFTDQNISDAMDYLASIGVNVVLPSVWNGGYTLYQSSVMDSLFGTSIKPDFTGRDPLKQVIIEAHRVGIEVYPWFEYGFAAWYSGDNPPNNSVILNKYPQWALRTADGKICVKNGFDWMSAVNPDVQNFINSLVKEVINNYDVDGVEFSDRIPALPIEGGYDSTTVAIYKSEHNGQAPPTDYSNPDWMRWRADKLNQWYSNVRQLVKNKSSHIFVSSSPSIYPWSYDNYLQDSQTWIHEGIADHFIPQLYRYTFDEYKYELDKAIAQVGSQNLHKLFAGILLNIGTGSNEYVMSPDYVLKVLKANRDNGVKGEAWFYYEGLRKNNNLIGDTLKATYYKYKALVPERGGNEWRPKAEVINEDDGNASKIGNWEFYQMRGFKDGILRTNDISNLTSISYNFDVKYPAYYDVFIYNVPNTPWTKNAVYTIYSDSDSTKINFDQSVLSKRGWQKIGTVNLSKGKQTVLKLDNSKLESGKYLVADASMLMLNRNLSPDIIVTGIEKENQKTNLLPKGFNLSRNFPNPFNPSTNIQYELPATSHVTIDVYDVLGNKVRELVNEEKPAGSYTINFNANKLASGIYFVKMQSGSFYSTRKIMLLK